MQLLVVHHDVEIGEQLVQMMKDYTAHECELVASNAAAVEWGKRHAQCRLLLTQLEAEGVDGLALGGALSEIFEGLQTLFLPPYPAAEQRLVVADTKIFPEPIDGDGLLEAVVRAESATPGAADVFHVADILQMCCLSKRGGAIQMVREPKSGIVFLRNGAIVHAETSGGRGKEALFEIASWEYVEFAYDRSVRPSVETITHPWDEILIEAVERQKLRKLMQERQSA
jgi:Domain of unknown function (DUF4388)